MVISIVQLESRVVITVDGIILPDVFGGYKLESSDSGELELSLIVRKDISVSGLSAKLKG